MDNQTFSYASGISLIARMYTDGQSYHPGDSLSSTTAGGTQETAGTFSYKDVTVTDMVCPQTLTWWMEDGAYFMYNNQMVSASDFPGWIRQVPLQKEWQKTITPTLKATGVGEYSSLTTSASMKNDNTYRISFQSKNRRLGASNKVP